MKTIYNQPKVEVFAARLENYLMAGSPGVSISPEPITNEEND